MKIKDTLFMHNSEFLMKANLISKEPQIQKFWHNNKIYQSLLKKNFKNTNKIVLDGPPYANGNLHVGHAVNKILKDITVRYLLLKGFYSEFIMGWDTHGLPIENIVFKKNKDAKNWNPIQIRQKCTEYVLNVIEKQNQQFSKFGVFAINNKRYLTLEKKYELNELKIFNEIFKKKLIYQDLRPIKWSWSSETALAEAEINYKEIKSPSIYVQFEILNPKILNLSNNKVFLIIWTTTPWTLPGNFAVAINKKINYSIYKMNNDYVIISKLRGKYLSKLANNKLIFVSDVSISDLIKLKYKSPLNKKENQIFLGDHVNDESGTGLVHISPYHGEDDFILAKKENINSYPIINKQGKMINCDFEGIFYLKANLVIIEELKKQKTLFHYDEIIHDYPHDWRTHKPIVYLATIQWFINVKQFQDQVIENVSKKIKYYPSWGKIRLINMIKNRDSWCISRQRNWGIPILMFFKNNEILFNEEIFNYVLTKIDHYGLDVWFKNNNLQELLPKQYYELNSSLLRKETDILDVWFDSGSAFYSVREKYDKKIQNSDYIFIEGSDQYRGWFNSSNLLSTILENDAACSEIVTHGFVLDENGNKMSKSIGNVVDPLKLINQYGADILRLWVVDNNYHNDILVSDKIITTITKKYRKLRNTFRFMLNNIIDINCDKSFWNFLNEANINLDKDINFDFDYWILNNLNQLMKKLNNFYSSYSYYKVLSEVEYFCINDLSNRYFDYCKDILYIEHNSNPQKKSIQKTLSIIVWCLVKYLSPILCHTCEEWYQQFKTIFNLPNPISIFQTQWINKINITISNDLKIKFEIIEQLNEILKSSWLYATNEKHLENTNTTTLILKNKLSALITIIPSSKYSQIINNELCNNFFGYGKFNIVLKPSKEKNLNKEIAYSSYSDNNFKNKQNLLDGLIISKISDLRCARCWKYQFENEVIKYDNDMICNRCNEIIKNHF